MPTAIRIVDMLDELGDVDISTSRFEGAILSYSDASNDWTYTGIATLSDIYTDTITVGQTMNVVTLQVSGVAIIESSLLALGDVSIGSTLEVAGGGSIGASSSGGDLYVNGNLFVTGQISSSTASDSVPVTSTDQLAWQRSWFGV